MTTPRRRVLELQARNAAAAPTPAQSLVVGLPAGVNRNSADDLAVLRGSRKPVRTGGQLVVGSFNLGILQSMITGKQGEVLRRVCSGVRQDRPGGRL